MLQYLSTRTINKSSFTTQRRVQYLSTRTINKSSFTIKRIVHYLSTRTIHKSSFTRVVGLKSINLTQVKKIQHMLRFGVDLWLVVLTLHVTWLVNSTILLLAAKYVTCKFYLWFDLWLANLQLEVHLLIVFFVFRIETKIDRVFVHFIAFMIEIEEIFCLWAKFP